MDRKNHLSWHCDEHTAGDLYRRRFSGEVGRLLIARQNELLLSFLGDIRGKEVLDVGAGHGQLAGSLLNAGARVTAYGSSPASLGRLAPHPIRRVTGALYPLPFGDGEFDVAASLRCMSHVPDWRLFLGELCRVARRAVAFDFVTGGAAWLAKPLIYALKRRKEPGTRDFTLQTKREIADAARRSGFRWRRGEAEFVLPLVLHRLLGKPLLMPVERVARAARITRWYGGPVIAVLERDLEREGSRAHAEIERR